MRRHPTLFSAVDLLPHYLALSTVMFSVWWFFSFLFAAFVRMSRHLCGWLWRMERGGRWRVLPLPFRMVTRLVLLSLRRFAVDNRELMIMCKCTCTTWKFMHMSVKVKTSHLFLVLRRDRKNVGLEFFISELHCVAVNLWSRCNAREKMWTSFIWHVHIRM